LAPILTSNLNSIASLGSPTSNSPGNLTPNPNYSSLSNSTDSASFELPSEIEESILATIWPPNLLRWVTLFFAF